MSSQKTRGDKIRLALFLTVACMGAVTLTTVFVFQTGDIIIANIDVASKDFVQVSNGRIFVSTYSTSGLGYTVFDNTTFTKIGERNKDLGGYSYNTIAVVGDLVYGTCFGSKTGTVEYWDSSNNVAINSSIQFSSEPYCVCVQGNYAYFGLEDQTVAIVNATQAPSSLTLVTATPSFGFIPSKILVYEDYIYAFDSFISPWGATGFGCDISNFASIGTPVQMFSNITDACILGDSLYTTGFGSNLSIYSISLPYAPFLMKSLNVTHDEQRFYSICVTTRGNETLALLLGGTPIGGFIVVNVTRPFFSEYLGYKMIERGFPTSISADTERIYLSYETPPNDRGVLILSKASLTPIQLSSETMRISNGAIITIVCFFLLYTCPLWGAAFFWSRDKHVASSKGIDHWITGLTVIRTKLLIGASSIISLVMAPSVELFWWWGLSLIYVLIYAPLPFLLVPLCRLLFQHLRK